MRLRGSVKKCFLFRKLMIDRASLAGTPRGNTAKPSARALAWGQEPSKKESVQGAPTGTWMKRTQDTMSRCQGQC